MAVLPPGWPWLVASPALLSLTELSETTDDDDNLLSPRVIYHIPSHSLNPLSSHSLLFFFTSPPKTTAATEIPALPSFSIPPSLSLQPLSETSLARHSFSPSSSPSATSPPLTRCHDRRSRTPSPRPTAPSRHHWAAPLAPPAPALRTTNHHLSHHLMPGPTLHTLFRNRTPDRSCSNLKQRHHRGNALGPIQAQRPAEGAP